MKKLALLIAAALVAASVMPAYAQVVEPQHNPISPSSAFLGNPSFLGLSYCVVPETSAPSVSCAIGSGLLYGLWTSGIVQGAYSIAFDTIALGLVDVNTRSLLITPAVFSHFDTTGSSPWVSATGSACGAGGFCPPWPVRFSNGLLIAPSGAKTNSVALYRLDATSAVVPVLK